MRSIRLVVTLALAAPWAALAQSPAPAGAGVAAQDTTPAPKKKGGLFGKMKGLTKSKLVNTVAKAALCTAVPGGSMLASAIEAKKAKSAKNAAAAAANMAAGTKGNCMPGMGLAQKAAGMANPAGVPGVGVPGLPTTGVEPAALSAAQMGAMNGGLNPEQPKQMEEQYRKMGMSPQQIQAMQRQIQAMQQMSVPQADPPQTASPAPGASEQPVIASEAQGLVLRGLPWMPGSAEIRPDARASFGLAMRDLASAIQGSGKQYKVQARVETQGKKSLDRTLSRKRASAVVAGLVAEGIPAKQMKVADGASDKDARILLQESK